MTQIDAGHRETLHVFAYDGTLAEATEFAGDAGTLSHALGGIEVAPGRAETVDAASLADLGLSAYLVEGLAAEPGPVKADRARLDAWRGSVVILLPGAVAEPMTPAPPLSHLGSYPLVSARPAEGPLRSASAEGQVTTDPAEPQATGLSSRRASGIVAMAALAAAFLVVLVVWLVAAA